MRNHFLASLVLGVVLAGGSLGVGAAKAETGAKSPVAEVPKAEAGKTATVVPTSAPATTAPATTAPAAAAAAEKSNAAATEKKSAAAVEATPAPPKPKPVAPSLTAHINLSSQTMTVREGGRVIHTWKVSTGRGGYLTPPGSFRPTWVSKMHYSKQYDDAPMPHSVFFNGGIAVHGTYSTGMLGRPASHGCVRLAPGNAARFFKLVGRHGMGRTRIVVHGRTPASRTTRVARSERSGRGGRYSGRYVEGPRWVAGRGYVYPGDSYAYRRSSSGWGW